MNELLKIVKNLPQLSGVYIFKDKNNQVLYVGKAKNI
ncbi:MAG: GIY-YIG nuclease family protein, partial [Candidatus Anstonellaceae archaeon]